MGQWTKNNWELLLPSSKFVASTKRLNTNSTRTPADAASATITALSVYSSIIVSTCCWNLLWQIRVWLIYHSGRLLTPWLCHRITTLRLCTSDWEGRQNAAHSTPSARDWFDIGRQINLLHLHSYQIEMMHISANCSISIAVYDDNIQTQANDEFNQHNCFHPIAIYMAGIFSVFVTCKYFIILLIDTHHSHPMQPPKPQCLPPGYWLTGVQSLTPSYPPVLAVGRSWQPPPP